MSVVSELVSQIDAIPAQFDLSIQSVIEKKIKPLGALGQLEALAAQVARVQYFRRGEVGDLQLTAPRILLFAADHGIAAHGVSVAPQAVTQQMVIQFIKRQAAINCFCQVHDLPLVIIDCGMLSPINVDPPILYQRRIGAGTADFSVGSAMSAEQLQQAIVAGAEMAELQLESGADLLGFGEMGIGNTSSAAALLAAVLEHSAQEVVGLGTGIDQQQLAMKIGVVQQGLARARAQHQQALTDPLLALQELGGFEIAQLVGAMLKTAQQRKLILVDGFIVSVAALLACRLAPAARDYMVFCHLSAEQAHQQVLQVLQAQPLLDLQLRLGEGTACALAWPLVRSALAFYNDMGNLDQIDMVL